MLPDDILPLTARATGDHLQIGGCDLVDLAVEFGTPLYLFDEATIRQSARRAAAAFAPWTYSAAVLYATKAFLAPFLARLFMEEGLGLDVTSEGEIEIARRVNFPADRIYLHGNCKTEAEVRAALGAGITHIVVDNLDEIDLLEVLAAEMHVRLQVLIRIAPDIDPHTHRYLATAVADNKFGLGLANGEAERALIKIRSTDNLEPVGLHVHLGSQISSFDPYVDAIRLLLDTALDWRERHAFNLSQLDLGGGWGVAYTPAEASLPIETIAPVILSELRRGLERRGLNPEVRLLVEPGRSLVARAGVALYRVGSFKHVSDKRVYASVDGGMGDNIRPALYGAAYTACVANRYTAPPDRHYVLAGRYCEQGDVLIDDVRLPTLSVGDLISVPCAGAYQIPMASNYNLCPRPPIVLLKDGQARLVRRRETSDDLLRCDRDDA